MGGEFISPNWHVILIHYPIALLTTGVLIELLTLLWNKDQLKTAGRWMILIGAFLMVPAAASGIYAFRDALEPNISHVEPVPWYAVIESDYWDTTQGQLMDSHIWYNGSATVLIVLVVLGWIMASEKWRRFIYWPFLLLLVGGIGLTAVGAWHGGEAVYQYGMAVDPEAITGEEGNVMAKKVVAHEHHHGHGDHHHHPATQKKSDSQGLSYFLPPLQTHIVLAGFFFAFALLSLALTFRTTNHPVTESENETRSHQTWGFWLVTMLVTLLTVIAGVWAVAGEFSGEALAGNMELIVGDSPRLLIHVILGLALFVLPLAMIFLTRAGRKGIAAFCGVLLLVVIPAQLWMGILLLNDGHHGPAVVFNTPPSQDHQEPPVQ